MIAIAAAAENGAIGANGLIPWHLPSDLKHFRDITTGHTVIMGRGTFESLPNGALPNRRNIVLTRQTDYYAAGAETMHSIQELNMVNLIEPSFVIGGEEIYRILLPECTKIYLTRVIADYPNADAFFPHIDNWKLKEQSEIFLENGIRFRYETYTKE